MRPRDQMSTAEETWEGNGRHGKGREEEGIVVDGFDASDELLLPVAECVDDWEDDQGVEDPALKDRLQRRRRGQQA